MKRRARHRTPAGRLRRNRDADYSPLRPHDDDPLPACLPAPAGDRGPAPADPRRVGGCAAAPRAPAARPRDARRQHARRAAAALQPLRDLAAHALPGARADGPQPRVERRHAGAAAAAAQLRRRRDPPDGAARRRDPGLLRPQRIVRGRGRRCRLRARSRGLGRAASRGALQRPVGAAARAGVADRARAAGPAGPRRRRGAQPGAGPLHRGDALAGGATRRSVRRRVHADADGDGRLAGAADDQRHPPERDRRSGVRRDPDDGARLRTGPVRHLGDGAQGLRHAARAGARQEPALVLSLPAAERRVRRRPARQPVRLGQLPRRDEAARRADRPSRTSRFWRRARTIAKGEAR